MYDLIIKGLIIKGIITASIAFILSRLFYRIIDRLELINERKLLLYFSNILYILSSITLIVILSKILNLMYLIALFIVLLLAKIRRYYGIGLLIGLTIGNDIVILPITTLITEIMGSKEYKSFRIHNKQKYLKILKDYSLLVLGIIIACLAPGR